MWQITDLQWQTKTFFELQLETSTSKEGPVHVHSPHKIGMALVASRNEHQYPQAYVAACLSQHYEA
jgi:hypothetical protein